MDVATSAAKMLKLQYEHNAPSVSTEQEDANGRSAQSQGEQVLIFF